MAGEHESNRTVTLYSGFKYDDKQIHSMSWNTFINLVNTQNTE